MTPSVGRIVHYVSYGTPGGEYASRCRAAVIADVGCWVTVDTQNLVPHNATEGHRARDLRQWFIEDSCTLAVLNPTGEFFNECRHDEDEKRGGTWHWPERDEADEIAAAREISIVRPGDNVLITVPTATSPERARAFAEQLRARMPDAQFTVATADGVVVQRSEEVS